MKKGIVATAYLLMFSALSFAQSPEAELRSLAKKLAADRVEFDFAYKSVTASNDGAASGPEIRGNGHMEMQGNDYVMTYGSVEIRRFGSEKWTMDHDSKDLVIEASDPSDLSDLTANPSTLLTSFDRLFNMVSVTDTTIMVKTEPVTERGTKKITKSISKSEKAKSYRLSPKASDTAISDMRLTVASEQQSILALDLTLTDGTSVSFSLTSFTTSSPASSTSSGAASPFAIDPSHFDSSWIITDLR